jgi:hypothetical protein
VHAIIATLASAIILFLEVQTAWEQRASYASDRVVALVALSCGYFAYDLLWSLFDICTHFGLQSLLKFDAELMRNLPYLAHHLACFLVYSLCLQRKFYLIYVVFFLFWELSTPFLNLRWMLLKFSDAAASKSLRKVVDLTFALCFIGARNICGNWAMWYLWHDLLPLLSLHQTDKVYCHMFRYFVFRSIICCLIRFVVFVVGIRFSSCACSRVPSCCLH